MASERPAPSQEELDVDYWTFRVCTAVTTMDAATADLIKSRKKLFAARDLLSLQQRTPRCLRFEPSLRKAVPT